MLADKTLLSMTLAATFVSGSVVGYTARASREQPFVVPTDPAAYYAPQIRELKQKGYDETELAEARQAYAEYFARHERWWVEYLETHKANVDRNQEKLEKALAALEARFTARTGTR